MTNIDAGGTAVCNLCNGKLTQLEAEQLFSAVNALTFISEDKSPERIKMSITMRSEGKLGEGEVDAIYRLITGRNVGSLYSGGDGSSEDQAVIINCSHSSSGVSAEYEYLEQQFGRRGKDWSLSTQMQLKSNGRQFDYLTIEFPNGTSKTVHFDISAFFGRQTNEARVTKDTGMLPPVGVSQIV